MVEVQTMKGVANRIDPESCIVVREGGGEALTGERVGRAIEPRKLGNLGCRRGPSQRKATSPSPISRGDGGPHAV
jgi:hypothetical protein